MSRVKQVKYYKHLQRNCSQSKPPIYQVKINKVCQGCSTFSGDVQEKFNFPGGTSAWILIKPKTPGEVHMVSIHSIAKFARTPLHAVCHIAQMIRKDCFSTNFQTTKK